MTLFRKDKLGKKIRSRYELDSFKKELSEKIFGLKGVELDEIIVKFEPEEMRPHEEIKVYSQKEFYEKTKNKRVSSLGFEGKYKGKALNILIDYDLSLLNILSDSDEINEDINRALNK